MTLSTLKAGLEMVRLAATTMVKMDLKTMTGSTLGEFKVDQVKVKAMVIAPERHLQSPLKLEDLVPFLS
jgi:hypothetical protein